LTVSPNSFDRTAALRRRRNGRLLGLAALVFVSAFAVVVARSGGSANGDTQPNVVPSPTPEIACGGEKPEPADPQTYSDPPPMQLKDGVDYLATITTSCGDIRVDLLEDKAPQNVNNFVFLANEGFYDGLTFHRIEQNSIVQGGSPDGSELGGPGYTIPDELPPNPKKYTFGTVAMANAGPNTAGSQFFIVVHDNPNTAKPDPAGFRPWYSIFGAIDPDDEESVATLTEPLGGGIGTQETKKGDDPSIATEPVSTVYIESIEITEQLTTED
jgi:cyclophilin family peptidyl-prolyl cis-trans isomerase